MDRRSVRRWNAAHRQAGAAGLEPKPTPGRAAALNAQAKQRLEKLLLKGAKAAGFPTDRWSCARVGQLIGERFGVDYHVDHIGRLLHGLGWSPQRPTRKAIERDEGAIAQWVKHDWSRLKKTPRA